MQVFASVWKNFSRTVGHELNVELFHSNRLFSHLLTFFVDHRCGGRSLKAIFYRGMRMKERNWLFGHNSCEITERWRATTTTWWVGCAWNNCGRVWTRRWWACPSRATRTAVACSSSAPAAGDRTTAPSMTSSARTFSACSCWPPKRRLSSAASWLSSTWATSPSIRFLLDTILFDADLPKGSQFSQHCEYKESFNDCFILFNYLQLKRKQGTGQNTAKSRRWYKF